MLFPPCTLLVVKVQPPSTPPADGEAFEAVTEMSEASGLSTPGASKSTSEKFASAGLASPSDVAKGFVAPHPASLPGGASNANLLKETLKVASVASDETLSLKRPASRRLQSTTAAAASASGDGRSDGKSDGKGDGKSDGRSDGRSDGGSGGADESGDGEAKDGSGGGDGAGEDEDEAPGVQRVEVFALGDSG